MKNKHIKNNDVNRKDSSPVIPQRNKIKNILSINERELNEKQKQFLQIALDKNTKVMFVSGVAGTSKTYMAVYSALQLMNRRKVSDLLYIRSAVESSESKLGFLPGEADDKMAPYLAPLIDKLTELLPKNEIETLKKEERISSIPVGYLRGLNWNVKAIIVDESQNLTMKELTTIITRVGEYSKIIILGDPEQSDINGKSGFMKMLNSFDDEESRNNGIFTFKFEDSDVVRSELVKFIVKKLRNIKTQ